jgi:CysZ protein
MAFGKDFSIGAGNYWKAFGFIFKHNLWYFFLFPVVLSITMWLGVSEISEYLSGAWANSILEWFGYEAVEAADDIAWYTWLWYAITDGAAAILHWILYGIVLVIWGMFGKYLMMIILSPVMAMLSEKAEKIITGNEYPFDFSQLMKDVWRGIIIALRNMLMEYLIVIPLMLLKLIVFPLAVIISPIQWTVGWYYYGFAYMDYVNERRRLSVSESVKFVRKHKGVAIGSGMMYSLTTWIPIAGLMLAPPLATVGAVLSIHELVDLNNNPHAQRAKDTDNTVAKL